MLLCIDSITELFNTQPLIDDHITSEDMWEKIICWLIDSVTSDQNVQTQTQVSKAVRLTALQTLNNNMEHDHFKQHLSMNFEYVIERLSLNIRMSKSYLFF